jgi:ABC-type polysaccharide/polyol phosphate transport system ATPase subunit
MRLRSTHQIELPADVLLSVQGVSRAAPRADPEAPTWLKRVLPKSGLAGQLGGPATRYEDDEEEDPDDEDEESGEGAERSALRELSFDVRAGEGLGVVGPDKTATLALLRILIGALPPTMGRVIVRGRVAALCKHDLNKYAGDAVGMTAVFLVARFLHWPRALIRDRLDQILEFARLDELDGVAPRPRRTKSRMRLLYSVALHMDASVYVVDEGIPSDDAFGERCVNLLAQRQLEGAAVVQRAQTRVEEVARLCNEVHWIEDGSVRFRGRPLEVAVEAEKAHKEELHPLSAPVLASLANGLDLVEIRSDGGTVEIDLEVLRKDLDLSLTLELSDHDGFQRRLEQPDRFRSEGAGLHRLRITVPGGLFPDGLYDARLLAEMAVPGGEPSPPREILGFELAAEGYEDAEADADDVMFELLQEPGDEDPSTERQVEWDVGRASA